MSRSVCLAVLTAGLLIPAVIAQEKPGPATDRVAATVNGQAIPQKSLDRALERFSEAERDKARGEILDFLVENALVDQYLLQQKIVVEQKEIDTRLAEIKKEIEASAKNSTFAKVLENLKMTEAEFTAQVANDLRWEKFALAQSTDTNLKAMFDQNTDMFNGSMARARHILLNPGADAKAQDEAKTELLKMRKEIEVKAADAVAKLPATADMLTREQERQKQIELAFSELAKAKSTCPSKRDGGDVDWFPRAGHMVEAFAKTAFALKPYEMSEPVQTQFGWHLILCTAKKPGQVVKFEEVKEEVREVYCSRLREVVAAHMKQSAKIVIAPQK